MTAPAGLRPVATDPELLPWLVPDWERLCRARAADRLPQAILIAGPRGVGKRALAELLARALLCGRRNPDGTACGQCPDCRQAAAGSHPDLVRVGPDPESKSGEIAIDAIRGLTERAYLTSGPAAHRPVLIDPADRLNTAAANALLKTLEEPAPAVLLCLIAEQPGRLPATIRSRCQQIRIGLPPRVQAIAWLAPRLGGADPVLRLGPARWAPLRALAEVDEGLLMARDTLLKSLAGIAGGALDPVAEAGAWNAQGARLSLDWLAGWLCDLMRLAAAGDRTGLEDPAVAPALGGLAKRIDSAAAHRLLGRVFEARGLTETTVNPLLLLESLLIEWAQLGAAAERRIRSAE
jgi:DNA polymerase-3 subunit delta'